MDRIERYEGLTGEELPRRGDEIKVPVRLSLAEFWAFEKTAGVSGWGSVQNNPCIVYYTPDKRRIEEYNPEGSATVFIEGKI